MAIEETLTAKLQFKGAAAIQGMRKVSSAFAGVEQQAKRVQRGIQNVRQGFAGVTTAAKIAAVGGATFAVKKFVDFERQFGAVRAVLTKHQAKFFPELREEALRLGETTSFTASQAAEAMENLARAGFEPREIITAIQPTLAAAAAEGMDLATAADIVASNMRAFGLQAKDASRIADTLAFISAKTNTNMVGLQEGLKFAAPVARSLGIEMEETAAAVGLLADVGLKGSLAGTGLKNALLKVSQSAKNGRVQVGKFTAKVVENVDAQGKVIGINLPQTMQNIIAQLTRIQSPTARAAAGMKLLGLRGIGAATAFEAMTKEKAELLFKRLRDQSKGAAQEMAAMRLDNISGQLTILTSAVEGFAIKIGRTLSPTVSRFATSATAFLQDTAKAFGALFRGADKDLKGLDATAVSFAKGFMEGVRGAKEIFGGFVTVIKGAVTFLRTIFSPPGLMGQDGPGIQGMTSFVIKFGALAVSVKVVGGLFMRLGRTVVGTMQIMRGALGAVKPALQGTIGFLTTKLPALGRILPRGLGKIAGAVTAAEKITAQPVRVVNFDEAGLAAGGPLAPGATTGIPPGQQPTGVPPRTYKDLTRLGKAAHIAGGTIAAVGAGLAGWQIGRAIDETFKLSSGMSNLAHAVRGNVMAEAQRLQFQQRQAQMVAAGRITTAREMAAQFANFARRGVKIQPGPGERKVAITRELAVQKIRQRLRGTFTPAQIETLIRDVQATMQRIPTAEQLKQALTIVNKIEVSGREIAKAVGTAEDDKRMRGARAAGKGPTPRTTARR